MPVSNLNLHFCNNVMNTFSLKTQSISHTPASYYNYFLLVPVLGFLWKNCGLFTAPFLSKINDSVWLQPIYPNSMWLFIVLWLCFYLTLCASTSHHRKIQGIHWMQQRFLWLLSSGSCMFWLICSSLEPPTSILLCFCFTCKDLTEL